MLLLEKDLNQEKNAELLVTIAKRLNASNKKNTCPFINPDIFVVALAFARTV